MAVARNLDAEKRALKAYQGIYKKNPTSTDDWAKLHNLAYPATSGGLPDEFKSATDASLGAAGITTPANPPLGQTVATSNLGQLATNVDTAQQGVTNTSQPNEALRVLQDAIRTKSGMANQPLGTSDVFKQAGLTGMGSLNASLAETNNKFVTDMADFKNVIGQMSGTYKDMATAASNKYDQAYTQYKDEANRLQKIQDDINQHKDAIDTMNQQYQNSIKLEDYKRQHPSVQDVIAGNAGGLIQDKKGNWVTPTETTFLSPSGDTYDVAKYAQLADGSPNPDHIANMNDAVQKMRTLFPASDSRPNAGQLQSVAEIDKFIQQYYPGSPITGDAVAKAAGKYGIDWETILATMAAETQMGTDGSKGSREYNYGNVGNTNKLMAAGKSNPLAGMEAGVAAVAQTMGLPYYKRNQVDAGSNGPTDPNSKSIMAQTGLSNWAFILATQGTTGLTRLDAKTKTAVGNEWRDYQIKNNIDGSTFQAQYEAATKAVTANALRNNQAQTAEKELLATVDNIKAAAKEAGLKDVKGLNMAQIWAGQQLNDPKYTTYKMHLQQLRNEFAMYNAAIAGQIDANGNIREISQSEQEMIANSILQEGIGAGSIDGFQKALKASMTKMGVVLKDSVGTQNKQVWDLFGVGDKYKAGADTTTKTDTASAGTSFKSDAGNTYNLPY